MKSALILCLLAASATASAQTIWRCGADGRSFSQAPCADGHPMQPGRTPRTQDIGAAQAQAAREQALAERLAQQRRARAALATGAAVGFYGAGEADAVSSKASKAPKRSSKASKRAPKPLEAIGTLPAAEPVSRRMPG